MLMDLFPLSSPPKLCSSHALSCLLGLLGAAGHVVGEGLALRDVSLLGLGVVGVDGGRGRVAGVRLLLACVEGSGLIAEGGMSRHESSRGGKG